MAFIRTLLGSSQTARPTGVAASHIAGLTRRAFAGRTAAGVAALSAVSAVSALPGVARADASATTARRTAGVYGGLRPLPASEAPFDSAGRKDLATDLLTFFPRQQGLFPGRGVYMLPAAPWFGLYEQPVARRAWDMSVPGGQPLYLMAAADVNSAIDPSTVSVSINGETIPDLSPYVHGGVSALWEGKVSNGSVLDLVFAPPAQGRYHIEVKAKLTQPTPAPDGDQVAGVRAPQLPPETVVAYDVSVQAPDSLSPALLRDPAGTLYAMLGADLRHVPDTDTLQALGMDLRVALNVSASFASWWGGAAALPALRDGMVVQPDNSTLLFRLQGGKRVWIKSRDSVSPDEVRVVEAAVVQTIPPLLQDDLLFKGTADDVFHVDRGTLRKIPDWKWAQDKGVSPSDLIYVPDRIIATLPQNSPEWRMPGGTVQDRFFASSAAGRTLPYRVYLPDGYDAPENAGRRYPVLYLLHGLSGRYDEWDGYGASEIANGLYADSKFPQAIMVMPQGGLGYWMNQEGGVNWADYVARELVAHVDSTYRTLPRREARAIGGLSMGAHGAMQIAMNFPDVFGVVGVHSPSIRGQDSAPAYFGTGAVFAQHDPVSLVRNTSLPNPPQVWIDAGQNDFWRPSAEALHQALTDKGWAHEWHVYGGEHDGWYWGDHMWEYLPFYAQAFQKNGLQLFFK